MYIGFNSTELAPNQITDYLVRVVQPRLQAVEGVQTAELLGAKNFALRAWLDPQKLAAYGLTAADVSQALTANDYIAGLGTTKGQMVQVTLKASTALSSLEEFRNLVLKQDRRRHRAPERRRQRDARLRRLRIRGELRRPEGGLYRHPGRADGQPARRHRGRAARSSPRSRRSCRRG